MCQSPFSQTAIYYIHPISENTIHLGELSIAMTSSTEHAIDSHSSAQIHAHQ